MTEPSAGSSAPNGRTSLAIRALTLLLFLGLVTGLVEGGYLFLQQHVFHRLTFASPDALWMTPAAYALMFGLLAVPVALLALLMPKWCTIRLVLGLGITLLTFSLLSLWVGLRLSQIALVLLSVGVGVQLGRVLAPLAERHHRNLLPLTGLLLATVGGVGLVSIVRGRWHRTADAGSPTSTPPGAPNVLLVILDTVRAASLGLYGYERPTSPRLDEFARGGVVFDSAYSTAPWTLPSHGSLFTGLYHQDITTDWLAPLDGAPRTLAEAFKASGYATAGFVGNLTYTGRESGLARGFDTYRDHMHTPLQLMLDATLFGVLRDWALHTRRARREQDRKGDSRVTAEFLKWLDQRRPARFFAFVNYFDVHLPRDPVRPGSAWDSGWDRADRYDAAIAHTDQFLGAMLDSLAARGVLEQTLVIIASDHGTLIGEHGLSGHGNNLTQLLLHVPLVVRGPGVPAGHRLGTPVSLRDLAETVRHTAGLTGVPPFPGTSLQPLWSPPPSGPVSPLLSQLTKGINTPANEPVTLGTMNSLIAGGYHYVLGGRGKEELFDLKADRGELANLAPDAARQAILDALRDSLRQVKRPGWGNAPEVPAHGTPGAPGS